MTDTLETKPKTRELNASQLAAVMSDAPTICVMAGPGSGKTETLARRIQRLVDDGIPPSLIVAITFTNQAANELLKRCGVDLGFCGTLHGYMLRLLQEYGERINLQLPLAVISEEVRDEVLAENSKEQGYRGTKKDLQAALDLGPFELKEMTGMDRAHTTALSYYQRLVRSGMVDYDSILLLGLELLKTLDEYDLKTLHLFVDEYQDSSPIDAQIYSAHPALNKFFVGDPDQSVYAFRGAAVENIVALTMRDDVGVLSLEENYRCDSQICEVAQRLIENNKERPQKTTRSCTGLPGNVDLRGFTEDQEELLYVAQAIKGLPDSSQCAVLVRTNKLVETFQMGLASYKVPMPRVKREAMPEDWQRTLRLLSLLCAPENDRLAYAWIAKEHGQQEADRIKLEALGQFEPINSVALRLPCRISSFAEVSLQLGKSLVSPASFNRIRQQSEELGDVTLPELVAALQHESAPSTEGSGVTVSTIHGAKGREWDHVFLPAFEDGTIPSLSKNASIEEERRLGFVAMTRARHSLTVTWAAQRDKTYGFGLEKKLVSRFVGEIEAAVHS